MRTSTLTWSAVYLALALPVLRADEARAVVEKAIKAHGGEDKLARLTTVRTRTKGTLVVNGTPATFTAQTWRRLPDRSKTVLELEINDAKLGIVVVHDGKKAWSSLEGQTEELKDERLAEQQARTHQYHVQGLLPLLKEKAYTLSPLGEIKVHDRPAVGVKAAARGQADIDLYFDKRNGLLVKTERRGLDLNQKEVAVETYHGEYKDVEGLKQPMKVVTHHDGKLYMEADVTELTFEEAIEDAEFAKP
jgi:hypothetical protein